VLAKYKFPLGPVKTFLEGGPSFRSAGNLNSSDPTHFGVSAGLGVEAQWRPLRVAPRVRYTRWAEDSPNLDVRTRSDQVEFLVAFSYASESAFRPLGGRISIGGVVASTVSADFRPETSTSTGPNGEQYTSQFSAGRRAVVVAPLVEFALTPNLAIEANAIPRSFRTVQTVFDANGAVLYSQSGSSGGTWEFPVLLKRRFQAGSLRPFVTSGPSFRLPKWSLPIYGGTVGLGVETRWKRLKIAPSVRYTRWGPERTLVPGVRPESGVRHDQVQVMVGWSF
jgi:hypothetical protein